MLNVRNQRVTQLANEAVLKAYQINGGIKVENIGQTLLGTKTKEKTILGHRIPRSQQETDSTADWLVEKFGAESYRSFFLKAAWRIDRPTLERLTATALELATKSPVGYFVTLVRREDAFNNDRRTDS